MKKSNLLIIVVIALLCQCLHSDFTMTTPESWTEGPYTSACSDIGTPNIIINQPTAMALDSSTILLKKSYLYRSSSYSRFIIKWYVVIDTSSDGVSTSLKLMIYMGFN